MIGSHILILFIISNFARILSCCLLHDFLLRYVSNVSLIWLLFYHKRIFLIMSSSYPLYSTAGVYPTRVHKTVIFETRNGRRTQHSDLVLGWPQGSFTMRMNKIQSRQLQGLADLASLTIFDISCYDNIESATCFFIEFSRSCFQLWHFFPELPGAKTRQNWTNAIFAILQWAFAFLRWMMLLHCLSFRVVCCVSSWCVCWCLLCDTLALWNWLNRRARFCPRSQPLWAQRKIPFVLCHCDVLNAAHPVHCGCIRRDLEVRSGHRLASLRVQEHDHRRACWLWQRHRRWPDCNVWRLDHRSGAGALVRLLDFGKWRFPWSRGWQRHHWRVHDLHLHMGSPSGLGWLLLCHPRWQQGSWTHDLASGRRAQGQRPERPVRPEDHWRWRLGTDCRWLGICEEQMHRSRLLFELHAPCGWRQWCSHDDAAQRWRGCSLYLCRPSVQVPVCLLRHRASLELQPLGWLWDRLCICANGAIRLC